MTDGVKTDPTDKSRDPSFDRGKRWLFRGARLRWGERLGLEECPYLRRWAFELPSGRSIRVHHFISSDDDRAFHDHPWWFLTFVFKGSYTDSSPAGNDVLKAPSIRFRRAHHKHTVFTDNAWTLILTGRKAREWGFWEHASGKFRKANKWFFERGHHQCD